MPIIRGNHRGQGGLYALGNERFFKRGGEQQRDVLHPNHSFNYLTVDPKAPDPKAFLPNGNPARVIKLLKALGTAMIEGADHAQGNSCIPTVYTYLGQFIDHDITAGTDRRLPDTLQVLSNDIIKGVFEPVDPGDLVGEKGIENLRLPELDLDSVYGDGPDDEETQKAGIFQDDNMLLKVGEVALGDSELIPNPHLDQPMNRDLPRKEGRPFAEIADGRNDENTIVAQLHVAFLRFHNEVATTLRQRNDRIAFQQVRQLVCWHYQWLVVNDYLRTICKHSIVDQWLCTNKCFFVNEETRFVPLEFSAAAFRFGHSMVRPSYDFNMNFGRGQNPIAMRAAFHQLFKFTGLKGDLDHINRLRGRWIIDWERFTDHYSPYQDRYARKIDTNLAMPLSEIPKDNSNSTMSEDEMTMVITIEKHLAQRNLLRSYLLSIPVGQHVAACFGIEPLKRNELIPHNNPHVKSVLEADNGLLLAKTPLWYYVLREAEVQTGGNSLGELGSVLVAGTIINLLKADSTSYLFNKWDPSCSPLPTKRPLVTMMDLFRFANVA